MTQTVPALTGYRATSAELRRIADALDTLPAGDAPPYTTVSFLPALSGASPEEKVAAVDAVALAVLGEPGKTEQYGSAWFHIVRRSAHNLYLTVQESVPAPDPHAAELAKLRARIAELEASTDRPEPSDRLHAKGCLGAFGKPCTCAADPTGLLYTRADTEPILPVPVSPGARGMNAGAVTDDSLVPEPIAAHYDASDVDGFECACGEAFTGIGALRAHIAAGSATPVTDGGLVDETPVSDSDALKARHGTCRHGLLLLGARPRCCPSPSEFDIRPTAPVSETR